MRHMRQSRAIILAGMSLTGCFVWAQENRPSRATSELAPGRGTVRVFESVVGVPTTLRELVDRSETIVEGAVELLLPARRRNPSSPASLETDIVVLVPRVLKWAVSGPKATKLIVTQTGGQKGDLDVVVEGAPLMRAGERYVLFLTRDTRPELPDYQGLARFLVCGRMSGRFAVKDGRIQPSAQESKEIQALQSLTMEAFVDQIRVLVEGKAR